MLTRSRGDFEEILAGIRPDRRGDGRHRARARATSLRAMRAGQATSSPPTSSCSRRHGEELWAAAREHGVQLRFEAAVAGVVPVIRVLQESLAAAHVERIHGIVNGTTNFILTEMARDRRRPTPRRWPRRSASATPRPTRPTTSTARDAAAKMAILARLAFDTPVHLDQVALRGHRAHHRRRHAVRARARARPEADRDGRARRRRPERARAPGVPVRRAPAGERQRALQRGHRRVRRDHRDHDVRARARAARRPRAPSSAT